MPPFNPPGLAIATLADFTDSALIISGFDARDARGVTSVLADALSRQGLLPEPVRFCSAVAEREAKVSTAMDFGVALPHARLTGLPRLCFALGRSDVPIAWGPAGTPIHLVFLFAVPEHEACGYLSLVSAVARVSRQSRLLTNLRSASTVDEVLDLLGTVPVKAW